MSPHPCSSLPPRSRNRYFPWLLGLASLAWVILRSIPKPSRLAYPCQRAALSTSWALLGAPLVAAVASTRWRRPIVWTSIAAATVWVALAFGGRLPRSDAAVSVDEMSIVNKVPSAAWVQRDGPFQGRVVQVHDVDATSWDYATGWYGDYVDQNAVTAMVTEGLLALTGSRTVSAAWASLIPDFRPGQKLAIKVNLNNAVSPPTNAIDALIEPVNALIGGLIEYGFAASDITVYDVTHAYHNGIMPTRFVNGCDYPGVNFVAYVGNPSPYSVTEKVHFSPPSGPGITDRPLANALVQADYLINLPIAKVHDAAGLTLGFKNHQGSIDHCDYLHNYIFPSSPNYSASYNPLVELYMSPHIGGKTVLTLCDCLYGNFQHVGTPPTPWPSFGNDAPNSVFLATDPVAIDCVVADLLDVDGAVPAAADDYLVLASGQGLGVFERSPTRVYSVIDYEYLEAPFVGTGVEDSPVGGSSGGPAPRPVLSVAPNPTSGEVSIRLEVPRESGSEASVSIYNCKGQLVRTLLKDGQISGGTALSWNATDDRWTRVSSGVYWCILDCAGRREARRIVLVR